jgi:hypothetical protein
MKRKYVKLKELLEYILFNNGVFCRIDIPIRVMAVKEYVQFHRINNLWWRMQFSKLWYNWGKNGTTEEDCWASISKQKNRLTTMADGFLTGAFPDIPITIGSNYALKDGSHRVACHVYFNSEQVPVELMDTPYYKPVGIDRLLMEHYTAEETARIIEYKNYILGKYDLK